MGSLRLVKGRRKRMSFGVCLEEYGKVAGMKLKEPLKNSMEGFFQRFLTNYSHSMVPGGLEVMSYTTRLTFFTSLITRLEMIANRS